jgi:uncharacterized Fe-S cluster protein YjdI
MAIADDPAREYETDEIVVEWRPRLCYHSHNCIRALPQVFDPQRRPWVTLDAATAAEVSDAVASCPSGALRAHRPGEPVESEPTAQEIRVSKNGPLLVRGGVRLLDAGGNVLYEGEKAALCRCGGSGNKPFCDGSHKTNGFRG